jgi:hypothetical protein
LQSCFTAVACLHRLMYSSSRNSSSNGTLVAASGSRTPYHRVEALVRSEQCVCCCRLSRPHHRE